MCVSELGLNMWTGRSKGLAPGKLAKHSKCHAIGAGQSVTLITYIRENPNSKFSLISEIFGEITSNFHRLGQITPLSKIS